VNKGDRVKFKGGYNVLLQGRPQGSIKVMAEPQQLCLPLQSRRFQFTQICVKEGAPVKAGDILAIDPDNYNIPLLAPRGGRVRLEKLANHLVLDDLEKPVPRNVANGHDIQHVERLGTAMAKRETLVRLGAWQFFYDAHTDALPDPTGTPQAVIVSAVNFEPFVARGDTLLHTYLLNFTRGLEHLQSLLEYQPIYFVLPNVRSEFADLVRNRIRGYAWVNIVEIPPIYPYDNFEILARALGLSPAQGPVWATRIEGVLAVDQALTLARPCLTRTISVGGIGVISPGHLEVVPGYPLKTIVEEHVFEPNPRVINGGILAGSEYGPEDIGVDVECRGITVLPELKEREFLGFMRPGFNRSSYSACFLSAMMHRIRERLSTGMRGELRPCVSCNFCEEVCPAGISPHLIHKYLYRDLIEEAAYARVDLCVECGLCSYVCPSKIDLRAQFTEARRIIEQDKQEAREAKAREESTEEKSA